MGTEHEHVAPEVVSRSLHLRALHEERREVDFVASTDAVDSYGEIVEQSWNLDRYRSNPVVLFGHNSRALPIGFASRVDVVSGRLEATIKFASERANPEAEKVWQSIKEGTLRAVSVGFYPHDVRIEKRNDQEVFVLSNNELFEISVVPIPANPEALAKMRARAFAAVTASDPGANEETMSGKTKAAPEAATVAGAVLSPEVEKAAPVVPEPDTVPREKFAELEVKFAALETQNATLVAERDAALSRAKAAEDALVERDVSALVGVKITPAEKENFIKLAKIDPELFKSMVKQRSTLPVLETVIPEEKQEKNRAGVNAVTGEGTDLIAVAQKKLRSA